MKRLYGISDGKGGVDGITSEWSLNTVELVPNPTWEQDDYTGADDSHWIRADRLAFLFDELCRSTGMTKKALSAYCGVTPQSFNNYISGKHPVPIAIWRMVEERKLK